MTRDTGPLPMNSRHEEPVHEHEGINTNRNKVNFTVPVDKKLLIEFWEACIAEGDKMIIELQADEVPVACIANGEAKTGGGNELFPQFNPLGPFAAGVVVRLRREVGTSGKDWSGGFIGYLEDE